MIAQVLAQTVVTGDLEGAIRAWTGLLEWEVTERGPVDPGLAAYLDLEPAVYPESALIGSRGATRGFLRLIQGPEDDTTGSFHHPGLFNAELLCRDVDLLYERLTGSAGFRPLCQPTTYDLGSTGGACSRSFATRGPGGAGVFFTTYLSVPPPRKLPICEHLVGPMFNAACAVEDAAAMESFYEGILGMVRRLEGRIASPAINRILDLPDDWAFHMVVYKGEGEGLIEVDVHEHRLPRGFGSPPGRLKPGNCFLTLETPAMEEIFARAEAAGAVRAAPRSQSVLPYAGRRAGLLVGPAAELVEIVEAG